MKNPKAEYGHSPMEDLVEAQRVVNEERARRIAAGEPVLTEYDVERIFRRAGLDQRGDGVSRWIEFLEAGRTQSGKTTIYAVRSKGTGGTLGEVRWFGRWRKYAFFPVDGTVFDQACLRDIATFCEQQTAAHAASSPTSSPTG